MRTKSEAIKAYAESQQEGATLSAKELLHLGERAAIDQALSRMVKRGELMRVQRGVFALPVNARFGKRAPSVEAVVENLAKSTGERVCVSGASAANLLGLSTPKSSSASLLDVRSKPLPEVRRSGTSSCSMFRAGNFVHPTARQGTHSGRLHTSGKQKQVAH